MAQGKLDEALKSYQELLANAKHLAASDRNNLDWQRDLLVSYAKLASVHQKLGNITVAALVAGGLAQKEEFAWFADEIDRLEGRTQERER